MPNEPFREPLRVTLTRTIAIAAVAGAVLARFSGGLQHWPRATLLMLWPSFGGHWVEMWFLNWLRPRISQRRDAQIAARIATWFAGGCVLGIGMGLTAAAIANYPLSRLSAFWLAGLVFVAVEIVAHIPLQLRGRPSFYNGRG